MLRPGIFGRTFMDSFFDDVFTPGFGQMQTEFKPMQTDVKEFEDSYQLDFELPGFHKEDIQAELKNGNLTIRAEHTEDKDTKDEEGRYVRRERYSGSFSRSFYVGKDVTEQDITANFVNGILTIHVPKMEAKAEVEDKHLIAIGG